MFYKIVHNEAPVYLTNLLLPRVGENNRYNLRNQDDFTLLPVRTESFRKSFFPQTIRDWNQLSDEVATSRSIGIIKSKLNNILLRSHHPHPWYYQENTRFSGIHPERLRNNCSALNFHLFINHVKDNSQCLSCPNSIEDPVHYFLNVKDLQTKDVK
jgi:hypothetical protein